jgi:hypothetical protein
MIASASKLWAAGAGAAAAVCSYYTVQVVAECDRLHPPVNLQALSAWLARGGVDMKGVGFRHTEVWCFFLSLHDVFLFREQFCT